ncbi:Phosphoribosylaminoimidazole-succinocarboxamide synthase (SAICAR synthetase) [Durusdinium trenchii]|uniref:phosphoribosylaminoimidazolesuccinocarboxamide synthase n=1 Tax=Durusdinium trenchii TaxID=1381693 RepID=A0ABP0QNL2_9DINO
MLQKALNKDGSQLAAKIRALPRDFTVGDYFTGSGAFSKVVDGLFQALMEFFPQETSDLTDSSSFATFRCVIEALSNIITDFFILENVDLEEGGPDSGDATNLDLILRALSDAGDGFHVRAYRLISSDFALPQRRVYLFVLNEQKTLSERYLWGSMAAAYEKGDREFCGLKLPEGLIRFQKLDKPIFTPTTKAEVGKELAQKAMDAAMKLFQRGVFSQEDTKYEFGVDEKGVIHVIDEEYEAKYPKIAAEMKKGEYKTVTDLLKAKPELKMKEFSKQYAGRPRWPRGRVGSLAEAELLSQLAVLLMPRTDIWELFRSFPATEGFEFPPKMAPEKRIISNLQKAGMIRGCLAIILDADQTATLPKDAAAADKLIAEYNKSTEPLILVQCSDTQQGSPDEVRRSNYICILSCDQMQINVSDNIWKLILFRQNVALNSMSTLGLERSPEGRSTVEGRPVRAAVQVFLRNGVLQLLPQRVLQQYIDFEKQGQYSACIKLLESATPGSLNVLSPASMVSGKPLLVETVLQLIVGYSGLCLKNQQGAIAVKLITQVLDNMSLSLRDLHPGHRTVLEAGSADTALSVCYYMPNDVTLADRSQSFFQQASERYLRLGHINRYCKCCLRAAAVLHLQGSKSEAEYYTQQALNKLSDAPVSSLLAVCYHNLAVHTAVQHRIADAVAHVRCPSLVVTVHSTVLA